jgi:hypothetical protein
MSNFSILLVFLYLISMASVLFVRFNALRMGNSFAVISSLSAFTLAALRPETFPDYEGYVDIFENASSGDFGNYLYWSSHSEPGFKIISYVVSYFGFDYMGLMILMSSLSFILLVVISRIINVRFVYLWFSYFSLFFITRDLALIRLAISSHIIVISIIQTGLFRKLFYATLASFTFQYFAFIATLAAIFLKVKPNINTLFILIFISLFFAYSLNFEAIRMYVPEKQLDNYAGTDHVLSGYAQVVMPFLRNISYAIILYYFMRNKLEIKLYRTIIWLVFLSSVSYIAFSGILLIAYRFSAYFGVIFPIAFAILLNQSDFTKAKFLFIYIMLTFSFFVNFYINNYVWF